MKRLAMTTCLLGAVCAMAGEPVCLDSYPIECQRLCGLLRVYTYNLTGGPTSPELRSWLLGSASDDFSDIDTGCDADAQAFHTGPECAAARAWIRLHNHEGACFHFWQFCYQRTAECMRTDVSWGTCFP